MQDIGYDKLESELTDLDKAFADILGIRPRLFSPPGGYTEQEVYLSDIQARDLKSEYTADSFSSPFV